MPRVEIPLDINPELPAGEIVRRNRIDRGDESADFPFAPSPDAPDGMPYWDPAEEKRYRDEEQRRRSRPERGVAIL